MGQKSKLLILNKHVNKTENIGGAAEKMKHYLIFSREIITSQYVLFKYSMTESSQ